MIVPGLFDNTDVLLNFCPHLLKSLASNSVMLLVRGRVENFRRIGQ
jgi:hypothetical protein